MPISGEWLISYSLKSIVDSGQMNWAILHHNNRDLSETLHDTRSGNDGGTVYSHTTSGREWTLKANAEDSIDLRATELDGDFRFINICFKFIPSSL